MTIETALALVVMLTGSLVGPLAGPLAGPFGAPSQATAPDAVLAEMAPAPGSWEIEDAPAYFSDRILCLDGLAPEEPSPPDADALVADNRF